MEDTLYPAYLAQNLKKYNVISLKLKFLQYNMVRYFVNICL